MATPKMKVSHRRTHMRFAHWLGEKTAPNRRPALTAAK